MEIRIDRASPLDRLHRAARTEVYIFNNWRLELAGESQAPHSFIDSITLVLRVNSTSIAQTFMEINGQGTDSDKVVARQLLTALKLFHETGKLPLSLQSDITVAGEVHQAMKNFMGIRSPEPEW